MKLLSNDSLLGRIFGHLGDIIIVNFLFLVSCIPIITVGAALCGMNYAFLERRIGNPEPISRLYIYGFKSNFKKAGILWLLSAAFFVFIITDIYAVSDAGVMPSRPLYMLFFVILAMGLFVFMYIFPVACAYEGSVRELIIRSFFTAAGHIPQTLMLVLIPTAVVMLMLSDFMMFLFIGSLLLLFGTGLIGWISSFILIGCLKA